MNEDIPIYSIVLLKIVAVVQVMFGLVLTFAGSFFLFTMMTNDVPSVDFVLLYFSLYFFLLTSIGLFIVYAGVQSLRVRLSVLKWILSCVLLTVCGAIYTYYASMIDGAIVTLSGMAGVILSGKYEKYQLRKSLKTPSKTQ